MNLDNPTRAKPTTQPVPVMRDGRELVARMDARFAPETYDAESNTIRVSLGTGAPVQRYDWWEDRWFIEVLDMAPESWRLDRMNSGAPFLADHRSYDLDAIIGKFVPGSVRVENGELVGTVKLSRSKRSEDNVRDILDGIISNTSVGYAVHRWADGGIDEESQLRIYRAVDIEGLEGSAVGIPADITGGIRSADAGVTQEGGDMAEVESRTDDAVVEPVEPVAAPVAESERSVDVNALIEAALAAHETRSAEIRRNAREMGLTDIEADSLVADRGLSAADALARMGDMRAEREKMSNTRIDITRDERETRVAALTQAMIHRGGMQVDDREAVGMYQHKRMIDIVRDQLGPDSDRMTDREVFHRMASSDFPLILANVANKAAGLAAEQNPDYLWYEKVFSRSDYKDFRAHSTPWLGHVADLAVVLEGNDYQMGTVGERNEDSTAIKFGRDFDFTFEMLVNDDLGAFVAFPLKIGEAALRTRSNLCSALLTGNQTMGDSKALFHNDHANLGSSGGVPTVARLNELWKLLYSQTENGVSVGRSGKFLLMPVSLKEAVEGIYWPGRTLNDFTTTALIAGIAPENRIAVPGMTGTAYYMATGAMGAAQFGFLRDEGGLVISQYPEEKADKMVYHARMVFGCHINRWQDFASNAGA